MYIADLIHSDVILFPHPDWGFSGDTDLDIVAASRKNFYSNWLIPEPGHLLTISRGRDWDSQGKRSGIRMDSGEFYKLRELLSESVKTEPDVFC
jgi:hypothetical protein